MTTDQHTPPIPIDHLRMHKRIERPTFTALQQVWVETLGATVCGFYLCDGPEQNDGYRMMRVRLHSEARHKLAGQTVTVAWQQVRHRAVPWRPTNALDALTEE